MSDNDKLKKALIEFFNLPETTSVTELSQAHISEWDSLAMVQLITELESIFGVEFEFEDIEQLRDYAEINAALSRAKPKG